MPVARCIAEKLEQSSWIRRMFEEGTRLKQERGADAVFDFTLGNPEVEPPLALLEALSKVVHTTSPGSHGYMPNLGFQDVRGTIAKSLLNETGLPFTSDHICMTVGAAGACNVILKSILDPDDEVLLLAPFFAEYPFYISNHGGRAVIVETTADFLPDVKRIAKAITPRTRAILLNTPNNPTGRIYPRPLLEDLERMLSQLPNRPLIISDEPYKRLLYDDQNPKSVATVLSHTAICYSWSKAQALAGERIGFLALSPRIPDAATLMNACAFANRTLGFVNAPALWQRVMAQAADACVDISAYQQKRDRLCDALIAMGYSLQKPEGGYYVFLKTPIPDDIKFVGKLVAEGILAVPGTGFGRSGYLRLSLTVTMETIERSLVGFKRVLQESQK